MLKSTKKSSEVRSAFRKYYIGIVFLLIAVAAVILILILPDKPGENDVQIKTPQFQKQGTAEFLSDKGLPLAAFDVEIADTEEKLQQGLMYRDSLALNQAMLFIFDKADSRTFWMKNTYLPLDMIFIGTDSVVVSVSADTQPFSEAGMTSKGPAQYVLEVNAGVAATHSIVIGSKFRWQRD